MQGHGPWIMKVYMCIAGNTDRYTVNNKSYMGENFRGPHGFHGFSTNCKVFSTNFISAILSVNIYTKTVFILSIAKPQNNPYIMIKFQLTAKLFSPT